MIGNDRALNIQGISVAGFRKDAQAFLSVTFGSDPKKTKHLMDRLADEVASAWEVKQFNDLYSEIRHRRASDRSAENTISATWIGLMISAEGLKKLDAPLSTIPAGDGTAAFLAGMANRTEQTGDTRPGDTPDGWLSWLKGVDALIVVAADIDKDRDETVSDIRGWLKTAGAKVHVENGHTLPGELRGHEHFGFKDGISQPAIDGWDQTPTPPEPGTVADTEFIYDPAQPGLDPFWADGGFGVYRRLTQDVPAFQSQAGSGVAGLDASHLGAKLIGRWPSGAPLSLHPDADDPADPSNAFQYQQDDPGGTRTPRFAHIRKVNPRDETQPTADDPQQHRMLRRGIPFGNPYKEGEKDNGERGLHFLAFVIDLARQFEFVQRNWANNPNFPTGAIPPTPTGDYGPPTGGEPADGPDPVGEHDGNAEDSLHLPDGSTAAMSLPTQFVHMSGGEYLFVPSITAIMALAKS